MNVKIQLIGEPAVVDETEDTYRPRSRKTWAILAYLLLSERAPSRQRLASLLFFDADDPLRALRWNLAELRRVIGPDGQLGGNPVDLTLAPDTIVDINRVLNGRWTDALSMDNTRGELLEGFDGLGSAEFELWLLSQRRRIGASTEAMIHEAVFALMGQGEYSKAITLAESLVAMNPYLEDHQAALIRAYALAGDEKSAQKQTAACTRLFADELGTAPGPAVRAAAVIRDKPQVAATDTAGVRAAIEAGLAAMNAGAPEAGVVSLRSAVALADGLADEHLRAESRIALSNALVHAVRGEDDEGALLLHEAESIALYADLNELRAEVAVELGYVDMLGARYDRSKQWLDSALASTSEPALQAKAYGYLGIVASDRANYDTADELLEQSVDLARVSDDRRREAYATSILGRLDLLRGHLDSAAERLETAIELGHRENWLAFLPWPQSFLGEVMIEKGELGEARTVLEQAFARACQIGDPCWEGISGRGLARLAEADGEIEKAFEILTDARKRCVRLSDTYRWAEMYILDAQGGLGTLHGHPRAEAWVDEAYEYSSRTGMTELANNALKNKAKLDPDTDPAVVANLIGDV